MEAVPNTSLLPSAMLLDMFESDPIRDKNLLGCTIKPWCGEPRIELLTRDYFTPNELFYVRNHLAVPDIDEEDYCLIVKGKGIKKHKFTLKDLKEKFPKHEVVTTLQCAGNRREDMHDDNHKIYIAPHWVVGAMSTAKWGGVKIRDVLKYCGMDVDAMALGDKTPDDIKHVQFEGYDTGTCCKHMIFHSGCIYKKSSNICRTEQVNALLAKTWLSFAN